ncbi:MAG: tRNA (cytidine(34)-2'-O)-methyltransferase [Myxococcota bacterium]
MSPPLHVVLVNPLIPPNTGNIGRLCLGVGARLHLVHPLGFSVDEKAVRRAGLDYWQHVDLQHHESVEAFLSWSEGRTLHLFSTRGTVPYTARTYTAGDVLVFGAETTGLPQELVDRFGACLIPQRGAIRSLNLSNAAAVAVYGALHQIYPDWFVDA